MEKQQQDIVRRLPEPVRPDPTSARTWDTEVVGADLRPAARTAPDPASTDPIEASLLPPSRRLLREFPVAGMERPYLGYLERRIQRGPRDLEAHVRRILLLHKLEDADGVHGALTDLFLVLGPHGRRLRARLLALAAGQLTAEQRRFFAHHLESGLSANEAMAETPQSRLSKQVTGTTRIVTRANGGSEESSCDAVMLARESIGRGQIDVALDLLEGALETDPGDERVCRELLDLYQRRSLPARFLATRTALLGRRLGLPEAWQRLADEFRASRKPEEGRP